MNHQFERIFILNMVSKSIFNFYLYIFSEKKKKMVSTTLFDPNNIYLKKMNGYMHTCWCGSMVNDCVIKLACLSSS